MGERGDWWWTGLKPTACPGFDEDAGMLRYIQLHLSSLLGHLLPLSALHIHKQCTCMFLWQLALAARSTVLCFCV
jgi:hypothetical protein